MLNLRTNPVTPRFKALLSLPMHMVFRPLGIALAFFLILSAVTVPVQAAVENDPLERLNRTSYSFNKSLDKIFFKPLATTYKHVTPINVQTGVSNLFSNLDDVKVSFNDLLQLDFQQASSDLGRVIINTSLGFGGVLDVADKQFGLKKHQQDFGKTLAHYGVESGPYLVLPLFGPSTLRDAFGVSIDRSVDRVANLSHVATRNSINTGKAVDFRASMLSFDDLIVGDEYLFVRGAFLQQREFSINGSYRKVAFEDF
jgi:phospholipid-binding lipoprotein MlaA